MINKRIVIFKILWVTLLAASQLSAANTKEHLLPVGSNFDTLAPYGKTYAEICERLLFPAPHWVVRYYQVIGNPRYDTGLTIYQRANNTYWLMVKQATPEIGDIVMNAYYGRIDLRSSLTSVRIQTSNIKIPSDVASEIRDLWLALLKQTRVRSRADEYIYIHPAFVILSAKDDQERPISGKYPADAADHRLFKSVEAIVDKLVQSCDARDGKRASLLSAAGREARALRKGRKDVRGQERGSVRDQR